MPTGLFGFSYAEPALKFLESNVPAKIRGQIRRKIEALAANPKPHGRRMVLGMKEGEEQVYRIRSGDYRILYLIRDNPSVIVILDIGHRKNIYRRL